MYDENLGVYFGASESRKDGSAIGFKGDVAQLARAFDWQSRGRGFESHLLH